LVGPSGYGKTHLFGRVLRAQSDRVQFIYVPMTSDPGRVSPADHVRWGVVEALFNPAAEIAPLRRHLARLLAPSFAAYFDQLDEALRAKCRPVRQMLDADPTAVLELLGPVTEVAPFHTLADSIRRKFPGLSAGAIRAMVLGLSGAADDARAWLRGERDALPEERLGELLLTEAPADATAVLQVVATLLQQINTPLLFCLDQSEWLMQKEESAFRDLTAALMSWLQEVPNLVLVLGCMTDAWARVTGQTYAAFLDRTRTWKLDQLSPEQAGDLVDRRMRSWADLPVGAADGWPFDLASLKTLVGRTPAGPRGVLQLCGNAFDKWLAEGRRSIITFGLDPDDKPPLAEAFLKEWSSRLEAAKRSVKAAIHYKEADLWEGVGEVVHIARIGQFVPTGVRLENVTPQAIKKGANDDRPSANIDLLAGARRFAVVLAVSKKDGGVVFGHWINALEAALGDPVVGAVVVWPKAQLAVGKTAKAYLKYREWVNAGTVRPFPLDENEETFRQLETFRELLKDSETNNLLLNGTIVGPEQCRRLLVETNVLANLKLFEMLFHNWPAVEAVRTRAFAASSGSTASFSPKVPVAPSPPAALPTITTQRKAGPTLSTVAQAPPLAAPSSSDGEAWARGMLERAVQKLRGKGQPVTADGFDLGPTFARLKVKPKDDTDFAKVKKQADNLKLHLALDQKPIITNQAGYISIDIQRPDRQVVSLSPLLAARPATFDDQPAFPVGIDVSGKAYWLNLADPGTCHVLVAGTTGSGKSEFLKVILAGLTHHLGPDRLQVFLIDPKQVTFNQSGSSPYLPRPVVHEATEAIPVIEECYNEMERRYGLLRKRGKDHVAELTEADAVPRWVVVFDEFADLMADRGQKREMEALLSRLGAKARASGIHLVLATQRPEASVVTPLLRSNLPGRISLRVISEKDSKLILPEQPDAAHLLGRGDLLWWHGGGLIRLQSPFVTKLELETILRFH
jgi:energy-coupling factor transporter ATP-binding protein EcfA2